MQLCASSCGTNATTNLRSEIKSRAFMLIQYDKRHVLMVDEALSGTLN